jgi:hypothetical protein
LTVEGKPIPAKQVVMHVVLTGSHIVFLGQGTVSGGTVDLYVDGQVIAHQQIDGHNSNVTKEDPCTVVAPNGQCQADLYYGDHTEIRYAVTLPNKVGQHVFGAQFTGDKKSHSSSATDVTVKAVYPNIAPVTSVLLD